MFKPYPKGVKISYRPFTFGEIKQYSQSVFDPSSKFKWLLQGIEVEGMNKEDLTVCDFTYITLLRNLNTFSEVNKKTSKNGIADYGKTALKSLSAESGIDSIFNIDGSGDIPLSGDNQHGFQLQILKMKLQILRLVLLI